MSTAPLNIKLQCRSWQQLQNIYRRDLARHAIFLKSTSPPPIGTPVRIDLTLPTESMIVLNGTIVEHVPPGGLGGRGPGIDIKLATLPQSALWLIETALASAQKAPAPAPAPAAQPAADVGVDDSQDLMKAEDELTAALTAELASLRRLNPFQVMGVAYDADAATVRSAFAELTKRYHPDRYTRYTSTQVRSLAAEIFIVIRDAYRRLADDATRARTLASLGMRASVKVPSRAEAPTRADSPAARASGVAPTQRSITPAPISMPPAAIPPPPAHAAVPEPIPGDVQIIPSGPIKAVPQPSQKIASEPVRRPASAGAIAPVSDEHKADFRAAEGLLEAGRYEEALAVFKIYARKNPGDRQARAGIELAEGLRSLAQRDRMEAAQRFEAVLEIDPTNERAARELADMRRLATNERKGLLSRLMGKKE
ncbi:MAG TPA: DnaJ domain-containing protein [Kofleriaceae bacterium]|nr:DnaJ domain-containing protein [Kofleriaceae bacterium]